MALPTQLSASNQPPRHCRITVSPSYEDDLSTTFNFPDDDADEILLSGQFECGQ